MSITRRFSMSVTSTRQPVTSRRSWTSRGPTAGTIVCCLSTTNKARSSAAGRVLINTHQDNVNAMDLDTLDGYGEPFCRNIHEPKEGQALGIWAQGLPRRADPQRPGVAGPRHGRLWRRLGHRLRPSSSPATASIFCPTHELNSGCAVIAYRMKTGGDAAKETPPLKADLSADEIKKIATLPWDWDMLDTPRLKDTLKSLPDIDRRNFTEAAEQTADSIPSGCDHRFSTRPDHLANSQVSLSRKVGDGLIFESGSTEPSPNCSI